MTSHPRVASLATSATQHPTSSSTPQHLASSSSASHCLSSPVTDSSRVSHPELFHSPFTFIYSSYILQCFPPPLLFICKWNQHTQANTLVFRQATSSNLISSFNFFLYVSNQLHNSCTVVSSKYVCLSVDWYKVRAKGEKCLGEAIRKRKSVMVCSPYCTDCQGRSDTTPRPRCPVDTKSRLVSRSPSPSKAVSVPLLPPSGHIRALDKSSFFSFLLLFLLLLLYRLWGRYMRARTDASKRAEAPPFRKIQHCVLIAQCVNCTFILFWMRVFWYRGPALVDEQRRLPVRAGNKIIFFLFKANNFQIKN